MITTLIPLISAAIIAVIALLLWRLRGIRVSRATIISAVAALLVFQLLFFLQGSLDEPGVSAPFYRRALLTLGIVLTFNAGIEFAKWALVEFALRPKRLRIPLFLVDLIGWIGLITASLLVISRIFALDLTGLLVSSTVVSAIIALSLQQLAAGRSNAAGSVTLAASATSTVVNAENCAPQTAVFLFPKTANAAAALAAGTTFISAVGKQQFTITHANNAQTDRSFFYACLG